MRGSVVRRGDGYSVVVELERDPITGHRRQKWQSGYKTKREAE
jgi:integrase